MSKVITLVELAEIAMKLAKLESPDSKTQVEFTQGLAELITAYCGGEVGSVRAPDSIQSDYTAWIRHNDLVPADGGVWAEYDTDVTQDEWEEDGELTKSAIYMGWITIPKV